MSNMFFTSDLHLGHKRIGLYRNHVVDSQANTQWVEEQWYTTVREQDTVWVLGDAAFDQAGIDCLKNMPGKKLLVRGNHDHLKTTDYLQAFDEIYGIWKKYHCWLSHAPIHPDELRGKPNVHGHVHYKSIQRNMENDPRYINVCCDHLWNHTGSMFMTITELHKRVKDAGL